MKKAFFLCNIFILLQILTAAQSPQFAVVRPDGTTYICPTWDSAYNKAVDGDNIYLPGVTINSALVINKRLNIYGAGHHPDSSSSTGKTTINSSVLFYSGSIGSSIEGLQVTNTIYLQYTNRKIRDLVIKRCRVQDIHFVTASTPTDSLPTNITITENLIFSLNGYYSSGNSITKNIIRLNLNNISGSLFSNNIFACLSGTFSGLDYNIFENNIFLSTQPFFNASACTNVFSNNLKLSNTILLTGCPVNTGTEINTIAVASISDIFISYNLSGNGYPYIDNYHLKPTCPGINAGTDGTDVGIYGTSSPTNQGWVPSNPHIYFKSVAPQTNASGQLPVQFKVRTNN